RGVMGRGARSGILGVGVLAILLQSGPRAYRLPTAQIGVLIAVGVLSVAVMVPAERGEGMIRLNPQKGQAGARLRQPQRDARGTARARLADGQGLSALWRRPRQLPRGVAPDLQGRLLPAASQLLPVGDLGWRPLRA